jgi:hypothetical protein
VRRHTLCNGQLKGPPVLGAPASLIVSELSYEPGSGPRFAPLLCLKDTAMDINNV